MPDLLTSMAVFASAVEKRSFVAAADAHRISPAMVGRHVRFLEERIGARLINRTTRNQSLSEVGRIYYERCKDVLKGLEAADACREEMRSAPRGLLKLHAPVSFGTNCLSSAISQYLQQYPAVEVDLRLSDEPVDLLGEGGDAAIRIGPITQAGLVARPLRPYRMCICAAASYLSKAGIPKNIMDLAEHNCLGFAYWHRPSVWQLRKDGILQEVGVRGRFTANSGQSLRQVALDGIGIVMQPEILLERDIAEGRLLPILTDYQMPSRPMSIIYAKSKRATPKLRHFVDLILKLFGEGPGPEPL